MIHGDPKFLNKLFADRGGSVAVFTHGTSHGNDVRLKSQEQRQVRRCDASGECQFEAILCCLPANYAKRIQ